MDIWTERVVKSWQIHGTRAMEELKMWFEQDQKLHTHTISDGGS